MEKNVLALFNDNILHESARRFNIKPDSLQLLSDMENFVYEGIAENTPIILRITHSSHRTTDAILAELDWLTHLHANRLSVPQSIYSTDEQLIEVVDSAHSYFLITAFQKLEGANIIAENLCTLEMYQKWGQFLGKMHALAKQYEPSNPSHRRTEWFANDMIKNAQQHIPTQTTILKKYQELLRYLHTLSKDKDSYGLIHADFSDVNFFVHDSKIMAFDFDDCAYHWFVYDIAVVLYDSLPWLPHGEMNEDAFANYFWDAFFKGYLKENKLEQYWLEQLPHFLKLREFSLYVVFHKKWDVKNLDLDHLSEQRRKFLKKLRHNIKNEIPCLNVTSLLAERSANRNS